MLQYVPKAGLERLRTMDAPPLERCAAFADACRINVLSMVAEAGSGHIGTSMSCLDVLSYLHLEVLRDEDRFFSSKGHDAPALYAVLAGLGRIDFDGLHRLRRLGGLPGHPDVLTTPGVVTNTGSLGMGISKAKGFLAADRLLGREGRVFVLTGDGELQEGQFWESLGSAANLGLERLWAVVDHNKIQSDGWVADVSDLGDLEAKFAAFGWAVDRCAGNDVAALAAALTRLESAGAGRPKILIADTTKGSGAQGMEPDGLGSGPDALYAFHSGAPTVEAYDIALEGLRHRLDDRLRALGTEPLELVAFERPAVPAAPRSEPQRLVAAYGFALLAEAQDESRLVALDADLVLDTGLIPFAKRFPERFIECGIAEQDMVSQAGAMALGGLLPAVHSFACFLSDRPNEQIYNNATEGTRVIYAGSLAGIVPGGPGHSHQCVRDISALGAIPGLDLVEPSSEAGVEAVVRWAVRDAPGSVYIRLVSVPWELPFEPVAPAALEPGRGWVVREGREVVLVGAGPVLLSQAWNAAERLAGEGIDAGVVELPWLRGVDGSWLAGVGGERLTLFLDNHYVAGGQGESCLAALAAAGGHPAAAAALHGVEEVPVCGTNDEVLAHHRLDGAGIAARVRSELERAG